MSIGVRFDKKRKRFAASIKVYGKSFWLGYFESKEQADQAYVNGVKKYFHRFCRLIKHKSHDAGSKRVLRLDPSVKATATIDGCYRYTLKHQWGDGDNYVMFLMMNPSAADTQQTDSTVAKCDRIAKAWGYSGILVGNVCAYRCTDPSNLLKVPNPVGQMNLYHLGKMADQVDKIIIAHGNLPPGLDIHSETAIRSLIIGGHIGKFHFLKVNKTGHPAHPLYLQEFINPQPWHADPMLSDKYRMFLREYRMV